MKQQKNILIVKKLITQNLYEIVHSRDDNEFLSVADYCNEFHSLIVSKCEICRKVTRTLSDERKEYSKMNYNMIKLNRLAPINFKERDLMINLKTF